MISASSMMFWEASVTAEPYVPMTAITPAEASFWAAREAVRGSPASSSTISSICLPLMPPRLVHFRNEQAHDLLHVLAFAGPLAGKRAHQADADSVRGKGGTGRQHEHGGDKHQFFHKFVHAFP